MIVAGFIIYGILLFALCAPNLVIKLPYSVPVQVAAHSLLYLVVLLLTYFVVQTFPKALQPTYRNKFIGK